MTKNERKDTIMDDLEKVERLRERADVSYEEAKKALDECGGNMLDAMVYLEQQGKVKKPGKTSYTTQYEEPKDFEDVGREKKNSGFRDACNRFFNWCGKVIQKGNKTYFRVDRNEENIIRVPVTVFVLLTILFFWILFWVLVAGLFLGCRYSFEGVDEVTVDVNKAMDRAAEAAESIKKEFTEKDGE